MDYLTKNRAAKKSQLDFLSDSDYLSEPFLELVNAYNRHVDELFISKQI